MLSILPYSIDYNRGFIALVLLNLGFESSKLVFTREFYQSRSWWNSAHRNTDKQQVLFSVVGRAKGLTVERLKVRVGSRKLAGRPQRNTERRSVGSVLRWSEMKGGAKGR